LGGLVEQMNKHNAGTTRTEIKLSAEFNMSSMTDIVFLLLIFFYANIYNGNHELDLVLPKAGKTDNKNIAMSINKELEFFIDKEPVSEIELESKLLTLFAEDKEKLSF
jgi:biopolymer transport protein ExbD